MAHTPNGDTQRRPPSDYDPHKQHSNGFITPDNSRSFTKSSSDTFAPQSTIPVPSEKNRSATCEGFPSFSEELHGSSSHGDVATRRLKDDVEKQAIFGTDVANEHEDWSEGSHTLGGSSDSAKTVKTEICLRPGKPDVRKTVHSWPESADGAKSSPSTHTIPSPSSFEGTTERKKRVRMKDTTEERPKGKDRSSSSRFKTTSSKDKPASSREKPVPPGEDPTSSKEKTTSSEAQSTSRSPGRPREKDVALKLPPATVQVPADRQVRVLSNGPTNQFSEQ